ncbi:DNA helicase UvrD [bacterium]|nr:DNA helicase UvrD [bacterium]
MKFIADLHIHSKYSRATSSQADLENYAKSAKEKGILVVGTGDFTHPQWLGEIKEKLEPAESGLFKLRNSDNPTRFLLSSEISCIYSKNGAVRKIHLLILAPSIEVVEKINTQLGWIGNLKADGRPTLGLDAKELLKIVLNISQDCLVIPAHIWTPWFSLFGSRSGFDSIEECFEEYTKYIDAAETGLSADPKMCWRVSDLDRITLVSNSDAHSPQKLGREANVFDTELSYFAIVEAIKKKDKEKFLYTIEFYPEEGKYHYDGHRNCGVRVSPKEAKKYNNICPVCGKPLTLGVLHRVEDLADREEGFVPENAIPYKSLVPLQEIIAEAISQTPGTKEVMKEYHNLISQFQNEFNVLLNVKEEDLKSQTLPEIAEGIIRVREGEVNIEPGYDGVFGKVRIFQETEVQKYSAQKTLF